ncbi:MAG: outer membrane lipoprotein carrier protein LolA [Vicinamibacterales bacterium]
MRWSVVACCAVAASVVWLQAQGAPAAPELARRIQAHYNTVRDFTADFTLTQTNSLLPRGTVDKGEVRIKKPLRMRWTYATGDKQQFVSDGAELYAYFPKDKRVTVSPLPRGNDTSTALLFVAGRGDLTKDFTASTPDAQPAGEWRLVLRPAAGHRVDFDTLTLDVARDSLALRGLVVVDEQGGTSAFRFNNLKENQGLTDREFVFVSPKNVEVERQ